LYSFYSGTTQIKQNRQINTGEGEISMALVMWTSPPCGQTNSLEWSESFLHLQIWLHINQSEIISLTLRKFHQLYISLMNLFG
jgi:hypothetical protein